MQITQEHSTAENGTGRMELRCLRGISNGALQGTDLPKRIKVLGWGNNASAKGAIVFDEVSASCLALNQHAFGFEQVAIDFEHNTVPGSPEYERSQEPRAIAGYGTPVVKAGDGLWLEDLKWTEKGLAAGKDFADLSPAVGMDAGGRVSFLHSVALTRTGAIYDLSFYSADLAAENAKNAKEKETKMGIENVVDLKPLTELVTALTARVAALEQVKPVDITSLSSRLETLDKRWLEREAAVAAEQKGMLISRFAAEGKVPLGKDGKALADEALKGLGLEELQLLVANTPVTVPLSARAGKPVENAKPDLSKLTGLEKAIAAHQAEGK